MELVSGGRSSLNPDAPLFVPAAYRRVEDFSPEWWQLVTTTTWFRDYWLSQHQDAECFFDDTENDDNDVADLLPDSFDFDAGEDFSSLEAQFDEFEESYETGLDNGSFLLTPNMLENGLEMRAEAPRKNAGLLQSWKETDPAAKKLNAK